MVAGPSRFPEAVVYPSALGNTLIRLQKLELQRSRERGESAPLTCSCVQKRKEKRTGKRGRDMVEAWKINPYVSELIS